MFSSSAFKKPTTVFLCATFLLTTTVWSNPLATQGKFHVDASGMANYSLPLQVPPGVNGLQPALSLEFTGSNSNGLLGVGWQLAGGGSVSRCGATPAQDGKWGGINFDEKDQLCLGGQRLMLINGTHLTAGAEYRFEIDDFTRIFIRGSSGSLWFEATSRQGVTREYGRTADARLLGKLNGVNQVISWGLNQVRDLRNNRIDWKYSGEATTSWSPESVSYGYSSSTDTQAPTVVRFNYDSARSDLTKTFFSGVSFTNTKRLSSVDIVQGGNVVYSYALQYKTSETSGRSLLESIAYKGANGQALLPVKLTWNTDSTLGYSAATQLYAGFGYSDGFQSQGGSPRYVEDINGDGRPDIVGFQSNGIWVSLGKKRQAAGSYTVTNAVLSPGSIPGGWGSAQLVDVNNDSYPDAVAFGSDGLYVAFNNGAGKFDSPYRTQSIFGDANIWLDTQKTAKLLGDVDGDGMVDLVVVDQSNIWFAKGSGGGLAAAKSIAARSFFTAIAPLGERNYCQAPLIFRPYQPSRGCGKWDGEVICSGNSEVKEGCYSGESLVGSASPNLNLNLRLQDMTGDGLPDLVGFANDGVYVAINNGQSAFLPPTRWTQAFANWGSQQDNPRHLADINRDGLPDIVGFGDKTWVAFNTGRVFDTASIWSDSFGSIGGWKTPLHPRFIEDVNGDGLPDILGFADNGVYVGLNNGSNFNPPSYRYDQNFGRVKGGWGSQDQYPRTLADLNGDGLLDVIGFAHSGTHYTLANSSPSDDGSAKHKDRLIKIESGPLRHELQYKTLSDVEDPADPASSAGAAYALATAPVVFPERSLSGAIPVLARHTLYDGEQKSVYRYKYGDLRAELGKGRGVSGFAWMVRTDEQDGSQEKTYFYQKWPLSGRVQKREHIQANGTVLQQQSNEYTNVGLGNNRVFIAPSRQIDTRIEPDGGVLPTTEYLYQYDCNKALPCYGNLLDQETRHGDGWISRLQSQYENNTTAWLLGLPKAVTETRTNGVNVTAPVTKPSELPLATSALFMKFDTAGSYAVTLPTDKRYARVTFRLVGGGGGGGGGGGNSNSSGGGGGGGAGELAQYSLQLGAQTAWKNMQLIVGGGGMGAAGAFGGGSSGNATQLLDAAGVVLVMAAGGRGGGGAWHQGVSESYEGWCGSKETGSDCTKTRSYTGTIGGTGGNAGGASGGSMNRYMVQTSATGGKGGSSPLGGAMAAGAGGNGGNAGCCSAWASGGNAGNAGYAEVVFEPFATAQTTAAPASSAQPTPSTARVLTAAEIIPILNMAMTN